MRRRTEMLFLLTIILFVSIIILLPIVYQEPYQTVTTSDYWYHSIKMQQFKSEGYVNFETDWGNIYRINGESEFYPPGFSLLLYSIVEVAGTNYYAGAMISLLFWPLFCLLLYLIPRKLFGSSEIALLSSFMGACFVSGSNMLGPAYPVASTLAVIMFIFIIGTLLWINNNVIKVLICSLFFSCIFVSHRSTIGAIMLLLPFIAIVPIFLTKNKHFFLRYFHYPLLTSIFVGFSFSMIFWINLPIEGIMTIGGILPEGIDQMLGVNITKPAFLALVSSATAFVMLLYFLPHLGEYYPKTFEPVVKNNLSILKIISLALIIPFFLAVLLIWFIISNNQSIPLTPNSFVSLWGSISNLAHHDSAALIIKQVLYSWHLNILSVIFMAPSTYLYLKSNKRNALLSISIGAICTLVLVFFIQDVFFDVKIQRLYFYLSPFIFILCAWGTITLLKNSSSKKYMRKVVPILIVSSILLVAYSSVQDISSLPPSKIENVTWNGANIQPDSIIASTGFATQESRGLGQMNVVVTYGLFTLDNHISLIDYLKQLGVDYIFIPPEEIEKNEIMVSTNSVHLIFSNGQSNTYLVGR